MVNFDEVHDLSGDAEASYYNLPPFGSLSHMPPVEHSNVSELDLLNEADSGNHFLQICILLVLAGLGLLSNISVLALLIRKCQRRHAYTNLDFLIMQLTIADILVALFCVLADAIWKITFQWLAGWCTIC